MALRPPSDFAPALPAEETPTLEELEELWRRHESARRERARAAEWRSVLEQVRRDEQGVLWGAEEDEEVPQYVRERLGLGPRSQGALRPRPQGERVLAAGVDTFSLCWYAEPGSALALSMESMATVPSSFAALLPEAVEGYRVGWFPRSGLVFAEGRPGGAGLAPAGQLRAAAEAVEAALADVGIVVAGVPSAGLRRLDVAVDLVMESTVEGLTFLDCVSSATLGSGKLCAYRAERCVESVALKSSSGRTLARLYDKGAERSGASSPRGRWLRLEAQWRFGRGARPRLETIDAAFLRERFKQRFAGLWQAASGFSVGGIETLADRVAMAVAAGQLRASRARTLVGYVVLSAAGIPQGARRTTYELERECRELGLAVSLAAPERRIDVARVLDECTHADAWGG